jgi:hypothetical protein
LGVRLVDRKRHGFRHRHRLHGLRQRDGRNGFRRHGLYRLGRHGLYGFDREWLDRRNGIHGRRGFARGVHFGIDGVV